MSCGVPEPPDLPPGFCKHTPPSSPPRSPFPAREPRDPPQQGSSESKDPEEGEAGLDAETDTAGVDQPMEEDACAPSPSRPSPTERDGQDAPSNKRPRRPEAESIVECEDAPVAKRSRPVEEAQQGGEDAREVGTPAGEAEQGEERGDENGGTDTGVAELPAGAAQPSPDRSRPEAEEPGAGEGEADQGCAEELEEGLAPLFSDDVGGLLDSSPSMGEPELEAITLLAHYASGEPDAPGDAGARGPPGSSDRRSPRSAGGRQSTDSEGRQSQGQVFDILGAYADDDEGGEAVPEGVVLGDRRMNGQPEEGRTAEGSALEELSLADSIEEGELMADLTPSSVQDLQVDTAPDPSASPEDHQAGPSADVEGLVATHSEEKDSEGDKEPSEPSEAGDEDKLPPELRVAPEGEVDEAVQALVAQYTHFQNTSNVYYNDKFKRSMGFRNPYFLEKMAAHFGIDECGTAISSEIHDPHNLPPEGYIDALIAERNKASNSQQKATVGRPAAAAPAPIVQAIAQATRQMQQRAGTGTSAVRSRASKWDAQGR